MHLLDALCESDALTQGGEYSYRYFNATALERKLQETNGWDRRIRNEVTGSVRNKWQENSRKSRMRMFKSGFDTTAFDLA